MKSTSLGNGREICTDCYSGSNQTAQYVTQWLERCVQPGAPGKTSFGKEWKLQTSYNRLPLSTFPIKAVGEFNQI